MISEEKKAYNSKYYLENKERLNNQNREYRKNNLEHLKRVEKEKYENNRDAVRARQAEYQKKPHVILRSKELELEKHGWTLERYEAKKTEHKDLCAICKIPAAPRAKGGSLVADHEHVEPPIPRGLLCTRCNTGLGQFKDNPLLLLEAIEYLARYALKQAAHA
jgi:hypothetical protein